MSTMHVNKSLASHPVQRKAFNGLESSNPSENIPSECENPPFDVLSSGSIICTAASDIRPNPEGVQRRQLYRPMTAHGTRLVKMDEALERLLDPYHRNGTGTVGGRYPNPYRPSLMPNGRNRTDMDLTATWGGELRVQNEALTDESISRASLWSYLRGLCLTDACAKEQTIRDLERLTAAGAVPPSGIRGSYTQNQNDYVVSCTADMRDYALAEDDLRVPSYLKNWTRIPLRRMQVPGMGPESGFSFVSSRDDSSIGCMEMDLATLEDYSHVVARTPASVTSSEATSVHRAKTNPFKNSRVARCVQGLKNWKKAPKQGAAFRETPSIREDRDYDFSDESLHFPAQSLLMKGNCFMCLGGAQSTRYSLDDGEIQMTSGSKEPTCKSSDMKSILLTTSPLYGDIHPTPRSHIDDLVYSTEHSLNIAATHNPTTDLCSESDSDSEAPPEESRDLAEIWDDDESDRDSALNSDEPRSLKHWDSSFTVSWEPPTFKTDQEYEMYQLQSRMQAEGVVRKRLTRPQLPPLSQRGPPDELVDTASLSSWDVKNSARDSGIVRRSASHGSSSWSDFGVDIHSIPSGRSDHNNMRHR